MTSADDATNGVNGDALTGRLELILERVDKAEDGELLRAIEVVLDRYLEGRDVHV